jgi:DnaJ-class molecular chaperone
MGKKITCTVCNGSGTSKDGKTDCMGCGGSGERDIG